MPFKKELLNADHTYALGINASKQLDLYYDAQILSEKLIDYLQDNYKDFQFVDFYDKSFCDKFKALVKDPDKFKLFLQDICFTLDQFLNIAVYVCPHCFTSNLIKFIKTNYI